MLNAHSRYVFAFAILSAVAAPSFSPAAKQESSTWAGTGQIVFSGSSSLHDFTGHVSTQAIRLNLSPSTPKGGLAEFSAAANVSAASMSTDSAKRDQNMWIMMGVSQYPTISGKVDRVVVQPDGTATGYGELTMHGITQKLPFTLTNWQRNSSQLSFHGRGQVSLSQYALKPPSVMGVIKVADTVVVDIDVMAQPEAAPATAKAEHAAR
jgi:polyisoprenoid-binding protein YceI